MSGLWTLVLCMSVLLVGTTGARVIVYEVRQARNARHVLRVTEQETEVVDRDFYGSMNYEDERALVADLEAQGWFDPSFQAQMAHAYEWHHELDWHEATMAELSPEALDDVAGVSQTDHTAATGTLPPLDDPGPGADPPLAAAPGPVWPTPGPFILSPASLAPVHERIAGIGDIHEAHQSHPHPEDGWLDAQLADLYDWVRAQLEAA